MQKDGKPVFLNLLQIHLPAAGMMSIMHRLTGVFLFFCIPGMIYLLQLSVLDEAGYQEAAALVSSPVGWLTVFIVLWALMHHFLAGIRYLFLDIDVGIGSPVYRYTAWAVMLASPLVALVLTWRILP